MACSLRSFRAGTVQVSGRALGRSAGASRYQRFTTARVLNSQETEPTQTLTPTSTAESTPLPPSRPIVPFEKLPYQCFQEARQILAKDRQNRLQEIKQTRDKIAAVREAGGEGGAAELAKLETELERLKVLADVNDPVVKMRFEDGKGDMNKPVYRYLADKKWRSYRREIAIQRIEQMDVIPDVLPEIDPTLDVWLSFGGADVPPGKIVSSDKSEHPPVLKIQSFERGQKTVSIVVVDPDVPDVERDSFRNRCHFWAVNVPITPTTPDVDLGRLGESSSSSSSSESTSAQVVHPWMPPFSQKGLPYHRLAVFVLEQPAGHEVMDATKLRDSFSREGFTLSDVVKEHDLVPAGTFLFRTVWDDHTAAVMDRNNIPGSDVVYKRKKPEKLPYEKKDSKRYR